MWFFNERLSVPPLTLTLTKVIAIQSYVTCFEGGHKFCFW